MPTGALLTLQGPTVTIAGGVVNIQAQNNVALRAGSNVAVQAAGNLALQSGAGTALQAGAPLDLKGPMIRLNGGTKPLATLGSQVTVEGFGGTAHGQIITGSPTILGN